jgi:hypothetical protein
MYLAPRKTLLSIIPPRHQRTSAAAVEKQTDPTILDAASRMVFRAKVNTQIDLSSVFDALQPLVFPATLAGAAPAA